MSKEYEKITKQLESLMGHCGSMKGRMRIPYGKKTYRRSRKQ